MQILTLKYKIVAYLICLLGISCCTTLKSIEKQEETISELTKIVIPGLKGRVDTLTGWWVYGEGQHIFKDEATLEEFDLTFPNENMEELVALYLSVCEMEYFPMECEMIGHKRKDVLENMTTLIVSEFNILYIQGCGE